MVFTRFILRVLDEENSRDNQPPDRTERAGYSDHAGGVGHWVEGDVKSIAVRQSAHVNDEETQIYVLNSTVPPISHDIEELSDNVFAITAKRAECSSIVSCLEFKLGTGYMRVGRWQI